MVSEALGYTHIFFKDKQNKLKGPYTERQVQEWYRERWFDSTFPFYFVKNENSPDDSSSSFTLDELRTRNGIGAPFILPSDSSSQEKIRAQFEQKLCRLEEEILSLSEKCEGVLRLMERIEKMEDNIKNLAEATKKKEVNSEIDSETNSNSDSQMKEFLEEIGNSVADFVLNAFAAYASGEFASWDKEQMGELYSILSEASSETAIVRRNIACEQILVEKMKKMEFFCCVLCDSVLFNYKHALIHFTSNAHCKKKSGIGEVRRILNEFTKLPALLAEKDEKSEQDRRKKYGALDLRQTGGMRPDNFFMMSFVPHYADRLCRDRSGHRFPTGESAPLSNLLQGDIGRKIMTELDEHIGKAPTWCSFCCCKTGDREGYYAHLISSAHIKSLAQGGMYGSSPIRFEVPTLAVNVHRKDLI